MPEMDEAVSVAAWKPGVSIYGWQQGNDDAFTSRHPALKTSKGTLQLRPEGGRAQDRSF